MSPSSPAFDRSALAVVWLRDDLRLDDNPALADAVASGRPVLVVHVDDTTSPGLRPLGGAARWWQERSLAALSADLAARGGRLDRLAGGAADVVPQLLASTGAAELHFARRLGSAETAIDRAVIAAARRIGVAVAVHPGNLLHDPATLVTGAGTGFRVFTPFWRALRAGPPPAAPIPAPARIPAAPPPTGVDAARS
ncbi:deoxyribodipyrimidine photo-lyase, partial [Siculibacillus lacustris]|uniref:deoxyribodipyrimidine photo-lyase n=1 Tax=Siculibacillus lacustris TaxID=1549641 RepID=UPI0013F16621